MEDYTVQCKLGDGAQGVVYRVQHIHTGNAYAMKVICCEDQVQVNLALQEIKVLLQMRHPNIVSYVDFFLVFNSAKLRQEFEKVAEENGGKNHLQEADGLFQSSLGSVLAGNGRVRGETGPSGERQGANGGAGGSGAAPPGPSDGVRTHWLKESEIAVCLVMELCSNGDLSGTIRETKQKMMETGTHPLTEAQVLTWMEQCAAALQFIHEKGFLHRDLKPTNVFFDAYRDIKIGDFGLAAAVGNGGRKSAVGTPYYLAPERMLQKRYDGKVDVWGLGVIILELLTLREQPVNSMVLENPSVVGTIVKQVTKMGFSQKLASLLQDMLQRNPADRPTPAALLQRIYTMTTVSPHPGMSATLFMGMSCPKLPEALCAVCEVEQACVSCSACQAFFCDGCDQARHKHTSRQSHERSSLHGSSLQAQQTLSMSRTSPANLSDQSRNFPQNGSFPQPPTSPTAFDRSGGSRGGLPPSPPASHSRAFTRLHNALSLPLGSSLSISEFSLSQPVSPAMRGVGPGSPVMFDSTNNNTAIDTVVRVPGDCGTLAEALQLVTHRRHVRKILVAGNTVHETPLELSKALPEGLKIVGESPAPVLEVAASAYALHCASGKGVVENFVIRHVGRAARRKALSDVTGNENADAKSAGKTAVKEKKPPRPTAISITGGHWVIRKCRISCVDGSGVTVGPAGGRRTAGRTSHGEQPLPESSIGSRPNQEEEDEDDYGEGDQGVVDPVIFKCSFVDVTTAGVVVQERCRGLYEGNSFSGCGYSAFLLKRESSARVRANRITDGSETGIFCQDAQGSIEYNLIAQNAGCGVVVKGPGTTAIFRKNRVLSNGQAGFFCCEQAAPFIMDNEIGHNHKAGVLIKTKAAPKVSRNVIEGGKEAGIYVFEHGAGIIEENTISKNRNAGLLVTTHGNPHVIHNTLTKNAYEGVWVCKDGRGTFCGNDLRANMRGPMDVDEKCQVTWVGNTEA